jgi:hypothetical protein
MIMTQSRDMNEEAAAREASARAGGQSKTGSR